MMRQSTNRDIQRVAFVESLHISLKAQVAKASIENRRFTTIAGAYMADGLEESECIELLMIDGLSREASEGYVSMALNQEDFSDTILPEYTFQFEDVYGRVWSSLDIDKKVNASTDNEAWVLAEEIIDGLSHLEPVKVLSINRMA